MKSVRRFTSFAFGLCFFAACAVQAAVITVEDFELGTVGNSVATLAGWTANLDSDLSMTIQEDPSDSGNNVLRVLSTGAVAGDEAAAWKSLGSSIPTTSTAATLYFRMRFETDSTNSRGFAGFSAAADPDGFGDGAAYLGGITNSAGFGSRNGENTDSNGDPDADVWYNVWIVADNSMQTYDVYLNTSGAATAGDLLFSENAFRTGAGGLPGPLNKLAVIGVGNRPDGVFFDDFVLDDTDQNLNVALVPEPSGLVLVGAVAGLLIRSHRRRQLRG